MTGWIKYKDPTRIVHYEGANGGGGDLSPQSKTPPADPWHVSDMISRMYPTVEEFQEMDASQSGDQMVISCEYTHAMGNSNGSLKEIWDIIHQSQRIAGAFVWDWMDQGILHKDESGCEQYVYGGYFGHPINDNSFCISRAFANAAEYDFVFKVMADGKEVSAGKMKKGGLARNRSDQWVFNVPFSYDPAPGVLYHLNVHAVKKTESSWAKAGTSMAKEQFALPGARPQVP